MSSETQAVTNAVQEDANADFCPVTKEQCRYRGCMWWIEADESCAMRTLAVAAQDQFSLLERATDPDHSLAVSVVKPA